MTINQLFTFAIITIITLKFINTLHYLCPIVLLQVMYQRLYLLTYL